MAGIFGLTKAPQKRLVGWHGAARRADPRALELQAAMEILAEIFGIKPAEVEEMIQNRFEYALVNETAGTEDGLWPREFWLEE
jgi:hypothetical protein